MKTVITANGRGFFDFKELRLYSGLLRYLSLRDVFVRYKQTWMGFGWSIVRPLVNIVIFGCISYLIDRSGNFKQRFLMVSAGVVFWQLILSATTEVSNSLTANSNILTKVYFPKVILPASSLLVSLIDFAIAFVLFVAILLIMQGTLCWQILLVPLVVIYGLLFSFGLGLLAATASVRYRDVKFILPFFMQILFYASPVFMTTGFVLSHDVPVWLKTVYQLNPLVFMINAFRYCMFGTFEALDPICTAGSVLLTLVIVACAFRYFTKFERSFADYI
jgi:lipopolysaccharide transport system permease protein